MLLKLEQRWWQLQETSGFLLYYNTIYSFYLFFKTPKVVYRKDDYLPHVVDEEKEVPNWSHSRHVWFKWANTKHYKILLWLWGRGGSRQTTQLLKEKLWHVLKQHQHFCNIQSHTVITILKLIVWLKMQAFIHHSYTVFFHIVLHDYCLISQ